MTPKRFRQIKNENDFALTGLEAQKLLTECLQEIEELQDRLAECKKYVGDPWNNTITVASPSSATVERSCDETHKNGHVL
jgi:hypothetical protein